MEKLIELLNEYLEKYKPRLNLVKEITDGGYFVNNRNDNDWFLCETIMSKKFWFIQWLVENEKIKWNEKFYLEDDDWLFGTYECLLMLLAIQDNPINFLLEILK